MTEQTSAFPFADRTGLESDFFEPAKIAHFGVEAPIAEVSRCLAESSRFSLWPTTQTGGWRLAWRAILAAPRGL